MDPNNDAEETAGGVTQPRRSRVRIFVGLLVICAGAIVFRLPRLTERPLHTDEAVHVYTMGVLLDTGRYFYDPSEYHGPTLYYFSYPFIRGSGAKSYRDIETLFPFRIVPVVFGVGLVLLLLFFTDAIGPRGAIVAGVLTAVSPAMVYYSRYYIQEMLLVFFTFGAIVAGWRYTRTRRLGWALLAGASLGLMHATKETSAIAYGAILGASLLTIVWARWIEGHRLHLPNYFHHWHAVGAVKVAAVVSILCLTALLSNPTATVDAVRSYSQYFQRAAAGGSGGDMDGPGIHTHPWYYYLRLLAFFHYGGGPWWSEGLILILAAAGLVKALKRRSLAGEANIHVVRFLAFYTVLLIVFYSAIPYKTPWCMLGFLHGAILMAGVGAVAIWEWLPRRWLRRMAAGIFVIGVFHLGLQAYRGSFVLYADARNPYVYGHTSTDFLRLAERMEDLAKIHPEGHRMPIRLIVSGSDYWPLPWYLRRFENVIPSDKPPEDPGAAVIITTPDLQEGLDAKLHGRYFKEVFGLRPGVLLVAYIQQPLWDAFMRTRE